MPRGPGRRAELIGNRGVYGSENRYRLPSCAPSVLAMMPVLGYRSLTVQLPVPNPVAGIPLFAAHVVLDWSLAVPGLSPAISFLLS